LGGLDPPFFNGGGGVFVFPTDEEMEIIKKKIESGLELEDWEIWIYREFM
jgi:hypothetical protein